MSMHVWWVNVEKRSETPVCTTSLELARGNFFHSCATESIRETREKPGLVGAEHSEGPHSSEGSKVERGAQMYEAGGLYSTSCVCSHDCDSPVWPHLTSPLPKQGLEEGMLQGSASSNALLFAQPTVRNIFLVKFHLIFSHSPVTFPHTFIYS